MMKKIYDFVEKKVGMDKVARFFVAAFVAIVVGMLFAKVDDGYSSWVYAAEGFLAGFLVTVGKEVFDFFNGRPFDVKDILAGVVGCFVAYLITGVLL